MMIGERRIWNVVVVVEMNVEKCNELDETMRARMNSPLNALRGVKGVAAAVRVDVTKRMGGKVKAEKTEKGRREKVMEEVNKMSLMF